jgi:HK97 family phage major capsid protein
MGNITKHAAVTIKSAAAAGEKTVRAVVTAPTLDRDGDIVDTQSLKLPLKTGGYKFARELTGTEPIDIPFLTDHEFIVDNVIGSVRSAMINEMGELEVVFGVSSRDKAQDMFTLLEEDHLGNAFSITILYDYTDVVDGIIYNAEIVEISLVFKGSNKDARLLAVSKSLLKEEDMAKTKSPELEAKYKELEKLTKEIEAAEDETEEDETPKPAEPVQPVVADPKADPVPEPVAPEAPKPAEPVEEPKVVETKKVKKETTMSDQSIATKAAGVKPKEAEQPHATVKPDANAHKLLIVKQIEAVNRKDWQRVAELNDEAKRLDEAQGLNSKAIKSKEISRADGEPLYLVEQLNRDVETCYGDYGNLGQLVNKINLTVSPKFSTIVQDGDIDFVPVGWAGTKPEDETSFSRVDVEPKPFAVIQVWNDHVAEDAAIALYDLLVRNVADAEARLEDRLITTFETVTADGQTRV